MKLQWLGHASFLLQESTGTAIITDPFDKKLTGFEMPRIHADIVTSSHNHADHNYFKGIEGSPIIIDKTGVIDISGVQITSIPSFHDDENGRKRGKNLIFKFRIDGIDVCHLGDIGHEISAELTDQLMPVNILLIPVGGHYTIDAEQAFEYVNMLMPDVVIPMHYKTSDSQLNIDRVESFLRLFDDESVVFANSDILEFERDDFEGDFTKVIIPKRFFKSDTL